jgi:uncharacterized membrane protein (DUF4010 family)
MTELEIVRNLAVAGLVGLAVGLEREWSGHAHGPSARFAGVRTFLILGLMGGLGGLLLGHEASRLAGIVLLGAGASLTIAAYVMASRRPGGEVDGTTEAAALLVLGLGVAAGLGWIRIASGVGAVTVVMLSEKEAIRGLVGRIGTAELRAAFQFAVMALVVLPLLPAGPYGPFDAIRPRMLWTVVLLLSGVNYAGYLARRMVGDARGYLVTGALGGLISSTAVTLAFSRASRGEPEHAHSLAQGTVAACVVLVPRVFALTVALNAPFAPRAGLALLPFLVAGLAMLALLGRSPPEDQGPARAGSGPRNPLQLGQALRMAVAFQVVLLGFEAVQAWYGSGGVLAGAAVAGLTDVDALTLSMSRLAADDAFAVTAARALAIGIVVNTLAKAGLALVLGHPDYRRRVGPALGAIALAGAGSVALAGL